MTDRFARLLDLKGFGAILFDEHFTVLRMNPAAEAMLGLSGAFRSHGSLLDLFPELVGVEVQIAAIVAGQDTSNPRRGWPRGWAFPPRTSTAP